MLALASGSLFSLSDASVCYHYHAVFLFYQISFCQVGKLVSNGKIIVLDVLLLKRSFVMNN